MILRGDSVEQAKSRIANDETKFPEELKHKTNYQIDSENMTLLDMTNKIHNLYINHLKNL